MFERFLGAAALAAFAAGLGPMSVAAADAPGRAGPRTGVVATPRNFPDHDAKDVADMFRLGAELGSFVVIRLDWKDPKVIDAATMLVGMAEGRGLTPVLELNPLKADGLKGAALEAPKDVAREASRESFADPVVAARFGRTVLDLARLKPAYLALATDVNLLAQADAREFEAFAGLYRSLVPRVREASPQTRVFVTWQWDAMQSRGLEAGARLVEALRPLDLLAFTSDPRKLFEGGPSSIPADYYTRIGRLSRAGPVLLEAAWPSEGGSGERDQVAFIERLPRLTAGLNPAMLSWSFLHDVNILVVFRVKSGLIQADGKPKPAFAAFQALGGERPAAATLAAGTRGVRSPVRTAAREPAHFSIQMVRLDGSDLTILISSPNQEMTHPRVSPDGKRIVITRYNKRGRDGLAKEEGGYEDTEILVMNLDGTGLETIIPARPGIIAANGTWAPDGKSLLYLSTDNPEHIPQIMRIDLDTRLITRMPTPAGLKTTDPDWVANRLVFPVKADGKGADALWLMNADGSGARRITSPPRSSSSDGLYGDFDPKLSPDGSRVAFMRIDGGESWRVMVLDLANGREKLLTPAGQTQWLPTWSSDGRLLLYVNFNRRRMDETGLYTMTPDGENRRRIPLPRGYFYGHSNWVPNEGSSDKARIVFNAQRLPGS